MRIPRTGAVATTVLAASLLASGASGRGDGARNGLLAFDEGSTPNGFDQIWVITPAGKGLRRLTHDQVFDSDPAWSPDGRMIAYAKGNPPSSTHIYLMNARGTRRRQLTRGSSDDASSPTWSPNGRTIAYSDGGSLVTIRVRGGKKHVLGPGGDSPAWSPDGRKIAYVRYGPQIFVMNADGGDQRRLTGGDNPAWSPDGKSIVFTRERKGGWSDILVMDSDGHNQHGLTKNAPVGSNIAWAPDGKWFAFAGRDFNLYVMPASGGPARRVDRGGHARGEVSWQPLP